jgi:hypothetical protein
MRRKMGKESMGLEMRGLRFCESVWGGMGVSVELVWGHISAFFISMLRNFISFSDQLLQCLTAE